MTAQTLRTHYTTILDTITKDCFQIHYDFLRGGAVLHVTRCVFGADFENHKKEFR